MPETLTDRQLNRATFARQWMLERSDVEIPDAVAFLLGLQAQTTNGPYQALWNRINGFSHAALTALIVDKTMLRATTMRTTLHLHTVPDMRGIRPLVQPVLDRTFSSVAKSRAINADRLAVNATGVSILDEGPITAGELGKRLLAHFPEGDPLVLAQVVQGAETLIQVPPSRIWGHGGAPLLTRLERWIGTGLAQPYPLPDLVLRYLAAYGPASVKDMQTWSGLTRLAPAFALVRDQLLEFTGDDGRPLYDLPDAPRPDADMAAPVRFLPEYDNVFLGLADRRRIQPAGAKDRMSMVNGYVATFTLDGFISGNWTQSRKKDVLTLSLAPFRRLTKAEMAAVEKEGAAMGAFLADGAATVALEWRPVVQA
jgi:hypothetical protein